MTDDDRIRIARLVAAVYAEHDAGGHLHVILDDGNLDDAFLHAALQEDPLSPAERECALALLEITEDDREALFDAGWGIGPRPARKGD